MAKDVTALNIDSPVEECMKLITTNRIRHLSVMEGDELTTVISITDVISELRLEEN
jgi:signal-transduction protein with cAMP-binding, CBS, and nucleotidyltransferase domain